MGGGWIERRPEEMLPKGLADGVKLAGLHNAPRVRVGQIGDPATFLIFELFGFSADFLIFPKFENFSKRMY
jgi:hypothetical protein